MGSYLAHASQVLHLSGSVRSPYINLHLAIFLFGESIGGTPYPHNIKLIMNRIILRMILKRISNVAKIYLVLVIEFLRPMEVANSQAIHAVVCGNV